MNHVQQRQQRNGQLAAQLADAAACLKSLAQQGIAVRAIDLGNISTPRLSISRPPKGVTGGTVRVKGKVSGPVDIHAAKHLGCQIEWRVER